MAFRADYEAAMRDPGPRHDYGVLADKPDYLAASMARAISARWACGGIRTGAVLDAPSMFPALGGLDDMP